MTDEPKQKKSVLPEKYSGGPHGLGDPEDRSLRKVERDVLILKKVRERSRKEKCAEEVKAFTSCGAAARLGIVFKCRDENRVLLQCLERWFYDEDFRKECTEQYIDERSEYRRTGIGVKYQKKTQNAPK